MGVGVGGQHFWAGGEQQLSELRQHQVFGSPGEQRNGKTDGHGLGVEVGPGIGVGVGVGAGVGVGVASQGAHSLRDPGGHLHLLPPLGQQRPVGQHQIEGSGGARPVGQLSGSTVGQPRGVEVGPGVVQ